MPNSNKEVYLIDPHNIEACAFLLLRLAAMKEICEKNNLHHIARHLQAASDEAENLINHSAVSGNTVIGLPGYIQEIKEVMQGYNKSERTEFISRLLVEAY